MYYKTQQCIQEKLLNGLGYVEEVNKAGNKSTIIVNSNYDVDPNSDMDYCFEIVVNKKLPTR